MTDRPLPRRLAGFGGVAAAGAVAALAVLGLVSDTRANVGPGTVEVEASVARRGATVLQLPPLGSVSASTHGAPIGLTARVDAVDVEALQRLLRAGDPVDRLEAAVRADIEPLARKFAMRSLVAALLAGALAGAVLPGRRWTHVPAGAVGGVLGVGCLLAVAWTGFRPDAFREPRFEGPIERAPSVLRAAQRHVSGLGDVRRRIDVLGDRVADLYSAAADNPSGDTGDEVRVLHVSDVHSNPVAVELVRRLAEGFGVDAVLDTGDLTSFGLPIEGRIGELIAGVGVPYFFVPGNHDSTENRATLGRVPNVRVLVREVVDVGGVRILGIADPTFTATNEITTDEASEQKLAAAPGVAELAESEQPDVLAVHDPMLALVADVPLVVAGHVHKRTTRTRGQTIVLTVGSTGATGLDSFTVRTDLPYEAQVLTFVDRRLAWVDYVTLTGLRGDFRVERKLVVAPSPSPSPPVASPSP